MDSRRFRSEDKSVKKDLYNLLISPLESELNKQGINNLVFIVDKMIRSLPFSALYDGHNFLIEKYSIAIMPGLTLTDNHYRSIKESRVLALGISKENLNFSPLSGVKGEISDILRIWPGKVLLDEKATFDNLGLREQHFQIIHIASHGGKYESIKTKMRKLV